MRQLPPELQPGDPISHTHPNALREAIRSMRVSGGRSVRVGRSGSGTLLDIDATDIGYAYAYLPSGSFPARTGTIAGGTTDGVANVTLLRRKADNLGWQPTSPAQVVKAYNPYKMAPPAGANVILKLIINDGRLTLDGWDCS
jgi:hypothetical protein